MKKIAFVFSGQGAQYTGMGKDVYTKSECAKEVFDSIDVALGRSISSICFEGDASTQGMTVNTQPCVFSVDLAMAVMLKNAGIKPDGVAGFSLGEYAALAFADVFAVEEAAKLVQTRAVSMQKAVPEGKGAMAAIIGMDAEVIADMCSEEADKYTAISNYNSPQQTVIAGDSEAVDILIEKINEAGGRAVKLAVSVPSHCKLMSAAADEMKNVLENIEMKVPNIPVYFNYSGEACDDIDDIKNMMVNQIQFPVRWTQTIQNMYADGYNVFIECGPGKTLMGLIKKILKGKEFEAYHVEDMTTLDKALSVLR